jgi:uncharacterized protein
MRLDLTDAEFDELDDLLAATPEPLQPLDSAHLDGFLCGVLVQPQIYERETWLPIVFDLDGRPLPADVDPAWLARCTQLIERRLDAMNHALVEGEDFQPLLWFDEEAQARADAEEPQASMALWLEGFDLALERLPALVSLEDEAVAEVLQRLREADPLAIEQILFDIVELADLTRPLRYQVQARKLSAPKVGRNDPCPCGSGRKYKHCHGAA